MNFSKNTFYALSFALLLGIFSCTTTDSGSTNNLNSPDNTEMESETGTENNGTGGDTSMNNDGMKNDGGAITDSAAVPE